MTDFYDDRIPRLNITNIPKYSLSSVQGGREYNHELVILSSLTV